VIFVLTSNASIPYEICEPTKEGAKQAAKECARYNIISFTFREIVARLDIVSAFITAVATAFVARYTFTLKRSTDMLWEASKEQISLTEKSLTELERPFLFIMDFNWLLTDQAPTEGHKCGWHYFVANGGKLPAFVKTVKFGLRFGKTIPSMQSAVDGNELIVAPLILGGEKRRVVAGLFTENEDRPSINHQIRGGLAAIPASAFDTGGIIAKISIEYDGPTTRGHITTVCWEWHPVKYVFTQHGGPEHNQRT